MFSCLYGSGARRGHGSSVALGLRNNKKQQQCVCLNNVEMKGDGEAGASESAARALPWGREKALHQQRQKGEERDTEEKKIKLDY